MKHRKIIGLAMMTAAALTASAESASATVLTSPSGVEYTGALELTASESLKLEPGFATDTCTESTMSGSVSINTTVAGGSARWAFSHCAFAIDILSNGQFEVKSGGEFVLKGSEWTLSTLGASCVYGGSTGAKLGTLTSGAPAKLPVSAFLPKIAGGGSLCADPAKWTGQYTVTIPPELTVD